MENKGAAEGVMQKAAAQQPEKESTAASSCFRRATAGEEEAAATLMDRFRQFKDAPRSEHWVCLKNKVRAAREYAGLMTRQGVSMFGEPKIGPVFQQEAGAKEKMPPAAASAES
ncbi:uncharacterized protein LOC104582712 [Brachypodium distachyon]|uniref:Uncharacterized protein n=1 Tax=Brachypodium distachyon TaxID=15368 RepID=I1HKN6_BRADI|nr:uncharacterized protein LOC104582712 [Brachypodium distachyon]KQK06913.1 hypothetical protein BRADI_2g31240v3 [Brachypodium distachyon]|eukprot:XP_010231566.1 uncharacterized protein LOC104582712 [Brachypodium distachyon]